MERDGVTIETSRVGAGDPADARKELMKECLRKAEEIRRNLEGRKHSDSTKLIAEDRKR